MASLVHNVVTKRFADLTPKAIQATKAFILDSFGVAMAGTRAPGVPQMLRLLRNWGGKGESSILAFGDKVPTWAAAMMNSFLTHNQEFDCVHDLAVLHPFTTTLPTALALAESKGNVSGRDFLLAIALGVDVACSLGIASRAPMTHFRPGTAGAFGAVAAAGKVLDFDELTLSNAMGIVYSQICGTLQPHHEGVVVNSMQTGFNARAAATAVALAAEGIEGPQEVLEGQYGYFRLFEGDSDVKEALNGLGKVWHVERVGHKPYPCGRLTHGVVEAALRLRQLYQIRPEQVVECEAIVPPLVYRLVRRPIGHTTFTPQYAKLSIPFVMATALHKGSVFITDFEADALSDPAIHSLAERVKLIRDEQNTDENAVGPAYVRIRLTDGMEHALTIPHALGSPDNPLPREQQLEKFQRCCEMVASVLPSADCSRVIGMIDNLEQVTAVNDIVTLFTP